MKSEYTEPFLHSTADVFDKILNCELTRCFDEAGEGAEPDFEVFGIIGLTGKTSGTVVVRLEKQVALSAAGVMLSEDQELINEDVIDATGELTNMIAGMAKAGLAELDMKLSLPTVITGRDSSISFGEGATTVRLPHKCEWGELSVDVTLREEEESPNS